MSSRADRLQKLLKVMRDVQQDCETEAMGLDGKPFDGRTVATQLGNMLAEISAVAKAVEILADELAVAGDQRSGGGA